MAHSFKKKIVEYTVWDADVMSYRQIDMWYQVYQCVDNMEKNCQN